MNALFPGSANQPPLILLAGPTASGKSALALSLWERLGGEAEIVSVDSAQVYRGMDIGTAKPDAATRACVPHHLLDLLDPAESYSAARFTQDAHRAIVAIRGRHRVPILVGGTMLYFRALWLGLSPLPGADSELRAELAAEAGRLGWPALHARLARIDPKTAGRLHPNDAQRIQRGLELHCLTGLAPSQLHARGRMVEPALGTAHAFALVPGDRTALHVRIEARFRGMMAQGLLEEVRALHERGDLSRELPSMRAVGYRQLWTHLDGGLPLEEAERQAVAATRQYAKRQLTWLRGEPGFVPMDCTEPEAVTRVLTVLKAS